MRIAVTGGSGFIGSHVVDAYVAAGHEVIVLDALRKPHRADVGYAPVSILSLQDLIAATEGCDVIAHLAGVANVDIAFGSPTFTMELNVVGTARVLDAALSNGVKRVILASTVWVYGSAHHRQNDLSDRLSVLVEGMPLYIEDTRHIYTASKIAAEMVCHNYFGLYGQPFTILRYGIPYGPRMRDQLVIPIFIKKALAGEPLTIQGDGLQTRQYVYVEDLAQAHVLALKDQATNETYNLEGAREVTIREIAERINGLCDNRAGVVYQPGRNGDYNGSRVSNEKARLEIGWSPTVPFEAGLEKTVHWFRYEGGY